MTNEDAARSLETEPHRTTLAPPEWGREPPVSVGDAGLVASLNALPVPRVPGSRADFAWQAARLRDAREAKDTIGERQAAIALARFLAARGMELDAVAKLVRRALALGDDPTLRAEAAGWLSALGEHAAAAADLMHVAATKSGASAAREWTKAGELLARAGRPADAADAFRRASAEDLASPLALELLGSLAGWAPEAVAPAVGALAFVEAADRRARQRDAEGALEDRLRAIDLCPSHEGAAAAVHASLVARGRAGAADELLRRHALALGDRGAEIHRQRVVEALSAGDVPRAVCAAFDAGFDAASEGDAASLVDDLLVRAGLFDLLAARLTLRVDAKSGRERAEAYVELARLFGGPLASGERALDAWIEALAADASCDEARGALRAHADASRDQAPLVEALLRAEKAASGSSAARAACLRELLAVAEETLADPSLATFATGGLVALAAIDDATATAARSRLAARVRLQDDALAQATAALARAEAGLDASARTEALRRLAALLRWRPADAARYVEVLGELVVALPEERGFRTALERAAHRIGDLDALERAYRARPAAQLSRADAIHARLGASAVARRRGDGLAALAEAQSLLVEAPAHRAAASMVLALASQVGDGGARAKSLQQLGAAAAPELRAALFAAAASGFARAGDSVRARAVAELACQADPGSPRAVAALAEAVTGARDRLAAAALERAAGLLVLTSTIAEELAAIPEALGEPAVAMAWTQRWLALRPGDPRALAALLRRAGQVGDATRLADAIAWALTIPASAASLAPLVADGLTALSLREPAAAAAVARRAADVLGPRDDGVRAALLAAATAANDRSLAALVLERHVSSASTRAAALLDVARARRAQGEPFAEARALVRAAREGASPEAVLEALASAEGGSSDALLARLEARAEALSTSPVPRAEEAAQAFREVGAARWDLAADPAGAVRAWTRAAELSPTEGPARLVSDLFSFGGPERAVAEIIAYAAKRPSKTEAAVVLVLAATAAFAAGRGASAFEAASRAVDVDPSRTDALSLAERTVAATGAPVRLSPIYDRIAAAALGSFGRRAAHYRGARQLERRGEGSEAARHAIAAFEEVPGVGMTFVLMSRLAARAEMQPSAIAAIARVADRRKDPDERAEWLRRAAALTSDGEDGLRLRVDVLLRALNVRPDRQTARDVAATLGALVGEHGEDRDAALLRFERAAQGSLGRIDGPEGARVAIAFAEAALETFAAGELASSALAKALSADADLDEYAALLPHARLLAAATAPEGDFLAACVKISAQPYANVGHATLRLAAAVARERGDGRLAAELLVAAARRAPDDAELVAEAEALVDRSGDEALRTKLYDAFPVARRVEALRFLGARLQSEGDRSGAIAALERARAASKDGGVRGELTTELRALYVLEGRRDALEALLQGELERAEAGSPARSALARELGTIVGARGDGPRALALFDEACEGGAPSASLLTEAVDVARQAGDDDRLTTYLTRLLLVVDDRDVRAATLRALADVLERRGDLDQAAARLAELGALDVEPREALAGRERIATRRGDFEALAAVLAERAALGGSRDEVRLIRLRRAALLEQRLGRLEEARSELETILASGEDPSATRFLADLHERLGAPLRAGPVWMRAFAAEPDPREQADHAARAATAFIAGGDLEGARKALDSALAVSRAERLLELRVQIERVSGTPKSLSEALDELAVASMGAPERRAELLVEASRASLAAGEEPAALDRAVRAARIAPHAATAQILARVLEYRARGAGTPQEAAQTIEELSRVTERVAPADLPLHAFLLAEALDVVSGGNAGMRELSARHAEIGASPLIALGMAERLARTSSFAAALPLFDVALAGDVHGVRRRGSIALAASDAAFREDELDRALRYLEEAAQDPATAGVATQRRVALEEARRSREGALVSDERATLRQLAERSVGLDRARALAGLARRMAQNPAERTDADRTFTEAIAAAELDRALQTELEVERSALRGVPRASIRPPGATPSRPPPPPAGDAPERAPTASERPTIVAAAPLPPTTSSAPPTPSPATTRALIRDRATVISLRDAALRDHDFAWARALDHALTACAPGPEAVSAPPLSAQREHPDLVFALLARGETVPAFEALGLVWESASRLFRREAGTYGVTGLDRLSFGAMTPASRVYASAARVLGATRTPMFQRRSSGPITATVALLSPPAVVLAGDPREESPELLYRVGAALVAAAPDRALLFGLPEAQLVTLLTALVLAFGAASPDRRPTPSVAALAESLWQALPARAQRRIRELTADAEGFDLASAARAARRVSRRAGLFVSGSLGTALREVILEDGLTLPSPLDAPEGLDEACRAHPALADLVVLATSREYAEARWHGQDARRRPSSGTLRREG